MKSGAGGSGRIDSPDRNVVEVHDLRDEPVDLAGSRPAVRLDAERQPQMALVSLRCAPCFGQATFDESDVGGALVPANP